MADQIQASDHPAWGEDWTEWLGEWVDAEFVETVVGRCCLVRVEATDAVLESIGWPGLT